MKFKGKKCKRISRKHFDDILIRNCFFYNQPKPEKLHKKKIDFIVNKKLSPIVIDEDGVLLDGYCAYVIATDYDYRGYKLKIYKVKGLHTRNSGEIDHLRKIKEARNNA